MNDLAGAAHAVDEAALPRRYAAVRAWTEQLAASLSDEDQCVQSMPDASPAKWHRAHTTWFFEQFVLAAFEPDYQVFDRDFAYLFNSYYEAVGPRHPRPSRGLLTRPSAERVGAFRRHVDAAMLRLLARLPNEAAGLVELGLQHEQQHQELLLTDMLHAFAQNPLAPAVLPDWREPAGAAGPTRFVDCAGGLVRDRPSRAPDSASTTRRRRIRCICGRIGWRRAWCATASGPSSSPMAAIARRRCGCRTAGRARRRTAGRHRCTGARAMAGGGRWGWAASHRSMPMRRCATSAGTRRMPSRAGPARGCRPRRSGRRRAAASDIDELTSHVWQWTCSAYSPYPGYRPVAGAVGEYNGKFMINQMVLRGASLATPANHVRRSYRNFFHPDKRWQFSGVRLARDV